MSCQLLFLFLCLVCTLSQNNPFTLVTTCPSMQWFDDTGLTCLSCVGGFTDPGRVSVAVFKVFVIVTGMCSCPANSYRVGIGAYSPTPSPTTHLFNASKVVYLLLYVATYCNQDLDGHVAFNCANCQLASGQLTYGNYIKLNKKLKSKYSTYSSPRRQQLCNGFL